RPAVVAAAAPGLAVAVLVGSVLVVRRTVWRRAATTTASVESLSGLAVLPFRNASGDASLDWLGDSLSELLSGDVSQAGGYRVIASDRLSRLLADLRLSPAVGFDAATIHRIG